MLLASMQALPHTLPCAVLWHIRLDKALCCRCWMSTLC